MVTVVTLPTNPQYNAASPFLISNAADLTSPLGGSTQRILRLGSRFGVEVTYPAMKYDDGRQFVARMLAAETNPVAVQFPQRGFTVGLPGAIVVDGAGQTGGVLNIKDANPGYPFKSGQFFDFITAVNGVNRRFVHCIVADVVADGSGKAALGIAPILRVSPADGDATEFGPILEGFVSLQSKRIPWTMEMVRRVGVKFTVIEDR